MMDDHERPGGVVRETAIGATETVPGRDREAVPAARTASPHGQKSFRLVATGDFHVGRGPDPHPHRSEDADQAGRNLGCSRPVDGFESCLPWTETSF